MKRFKINIILLVLLTLTVFSCQNTEELIHRFEAKAQRIQQKMAPDLSLNVFSATLVHRPGQWVLRGETTVPEARQVLLALADSLIGAGSYVDSLLLLPHPALGDSTYAIVTVSVAHLRDRAAHAAQMVDQYIGGRVLRLLKNKGGWYLVQTDYGYIGWMRRESFVRTDAAGVQRWQNSDLVRVTALYPIVYSQPDVHSEPVSDAVLNMLLRQVERKGNWVKVAFPDGREGYLRCSEVVPLKEDRVKGDLRKAIIRTARSMMGVPYLWGGNSSKAHDCSGFVQTVFKANGISLPRDARQQARVGTEIHPDSLFSNVLPGDLLFFGSKDKIVHVGISLGGMEYIHQSGMVHINSFDPQSKKYSDFRRRTLQKVVRVIK